MVRNIAPDFPKVVQSAIAQGTGPLNMPGAKALSKMIFSFPVRFQWEFGPDGEFNHAMVWLEEGGPLNPNFGGRGQGKPRTNPNAGRDQPAPGQGGESGSFPLLGPEDGTTHRHWPGQW